MATKKKTASPKHTMTDAELRRAWQRFNTQHQRDVFMRSCPKPTGNVKGGDSASVLTEDVDPDCFRAQILPNGSLIVEFDEGTSALQTKTCTYWGFSGGGEIDDPYWFEWREDREQPYTRWTLAEILEQR